MFIVGFDPLGFVSYLNTETIISPKPLHKAQVLKTYFLNQWFSLG